MFKVGKLYICEEYFLLLYPDPETAAAAALHRAALSMPSNVGKSEVVRTGLRHALAAIDADYWSKRFGKPVLYAKKNIPLLILNNREKYVEVLAGDRKGWIIVEDWLGIKEISNENIS